MSAREPGRAKLSDSSALVELLDSPVPAVVTTVSPGAQPQVSVVWFERRGEAITFFVEDPSVKLRNLRRDPRLILVVVDPVRLLAPGTPAYVRLSGTAEIQPPEEGLPDHLARRYGIDGGYPWKLGPFHTMQVCVRRISGLGPFPTRRMSGWADLG